MFSIKNLTNEKKSEIKNTVLIFLLLLPHFEPSYFNNGGTIIDNIFNIGRLISACFIGIIYLHSCIKDKRISPVFIIFTILQLYIFINTTIQQGMHKDLLISIFSVYFPLMIIDYFLAKSTKELIHALLIMLEILLYINFALMIFYPKGLYAPDCYFLGNRCMLIVYLILGLTFSLIWTEYKGNKIRFYILFAVCLFSNLIGRSATGLLSLVFFALLYFTKFYKNKHITIFSGIIGYFILFFAGVIFRLQNYFGTFFGLLGKNITFSGRTFIWDESLKMILNHPIFGYGFIPYDIRFNSSMNAYHSHNFILEHMVKGGIIEILIIAIFFIFIIRNMKNVKNEKITKYIVLGILVVFLHFLVEEGQKFVCYILFFFAAYSENICNILSSKIVKQEKKKKSK